MQHTCIQHGTKSAGQQGIVNCANTTTTTTTTTKFVIAEDRRPRTKTLQFSKSLCLLQPGHIPLQSYQSTPGCMSSVQRLLGLPLDVVRLRFVPPCRLTSTHTHTHTDGIWSAYMNNSDSWAVKKLILLTVSSRHWSELISRKHFVESIRLKRWIVNSACVV